MFAREIISSRANCVFISSFRCIFLKYHRELGPHHPKSVQFFDTFHRKKHFLHFFLQWCLRERLTSQRKNKEIINLTQISLKTRKPGPMDMFHTDLTNLTDGKSLRPCLSATPSVSSRMVAASTSCDAAHFVRFVRSVRDHNQR